MEASRSSSALHPNSLAAMHAAAASKSLGYANPALQPQATYHPALMQPWRYMQQPQGLSGLPLPPGTALGPMVQYAGMPRHVSGQPLHPQQLLALQYQAQLAQQAGLIQPMYQQLAQSPASTLPPPEEPYDYDQPPPEKVPVDPKVVEKIQKRALFVAPPVRQRIAQACERCRKRKTKCTGEKPVCKRCAKNDHECVYVLEHRANKTKKAIAERHKAALDAQQVAMIEYDRALLAGEIPMEICPPAVPSLSSSSGYSMASASSLPPPYMTGYARSQPYCPLAAPSHSMSSNYSADSSAPSLLPTPAIMLDGRPLATPETLPSQAQAQVPSSRPISRPRYNARTGRSRAQASKSAPDVRAISESTSAMSLQSSGLSPCGPSSSCEACLSEMSNCTACLEEMGHLHPQQYHAAVRNPRPLPPPVEAPVRDPLSAGPQLQGREQIMAALSQLALAKQAAVPDLDRAASSSPDIPLAIAVPRLTRDASSSSSGSGMQSGIQTPQDYFSYQPHANAPVPSAYSPAAENTMKISESMAMEDRYGTMSPSSSAMTHDEMVYSRDEEGALHFSEIFHPFSPVTESEQSAGGF
ncbi:hypothetical protein GY45DRAFT_1368300 [Cubamyces sp. BRFM 1775]|nr:hypothetical protein GY45DRAFT_1368300 [Cubamyces sp. BRFM 1775]